MRIDFNLDAFWTDATPVANPAEFAAALKPFAAKLQLFCREMAGVDDRFGALKRNRSRVNFGDLLPEKAAALVLKDSFATSVSDLTSTKGYASLTVANGISSFNAASVRMRADDAFWQDETRIRRVATAFIDFWNADQACVYTLSLPGSEWRDSSPWYFWLDWRRTREQPTLLPDVPVFGEPSIEREWHGGVERLWPEHEPWRHVGIR